MGLCSCSRIMVVFGLLWPVYVSFKTINGRNGHKTLVALKYWLGIGSYFLLDCVAETLFDTDGHFAHFVCGLRLAAFVWVLVQAPEDIYETFLGPQLKAWEPSVDKWLAKLNFTIRM
ncbi:hypothetical protein MRX96_038033 [Rhipicephalus microplus]